MIAIKVIVVLFIFAQCECFWPIPVFTSLPTFPENALFLIFPGFGGPDEHTSKIMQMVKGSDSVYNFERSVFCYDWSKYRGNVLTAAFTSQKLGTFVGKQIADHFRNKTSQEICTSPPNLHVVGISVGAFAADSCVTEFKQRMTTFHNPPCNNSSITRISFLDPFTSRGIFGFRYGPKYFGRSADYCEHYLNSDDPVPFTNTPLPNACTFDVTGAHERRQFVPRPGDSMHSWPVAFFGRNWRTQIDPRLNNRIFAGSHAVNPRGKVVFVK